MLPRMRRRILVPALTAAALALLAPAASADRVLRVGTWHGVPGGFTDVQAAVDAAAPNDWSPSRRGTITRRRP